MIKTFLPINPDKRLAVTLAVTFAWEVLPVFEAVYPNDSRPREAIKLAWKWLAGETISDDTLIFFAREADDASEYASGESLHYQNFSDIDNSIIFFNAANSASLASFPINIIINKYPLSYFWVNYSADWADKALGNNIIPDLIQGLFPLIIDYAIQNQVKLFTGPGNFDEVFESLPEDYRDKVWYNLELFGV